ncbi:hypothetical protein ABZ865_27795 [Streptomyces sp. NPDC047085]|uniref:hypothetical protein n=1 Tax=Streptomyces sp. NPDC047085 TaxID=3155140 RepID=UPI0033EA1D6B
MRLRTPPLLSLPLCLAAATTSATAAALAPLSPALAHAAPASASPSPSSPSCAAPGDHAFPLTTRIHDGPASYEAGGDYGTWYIDLTNTTRQTCTDVHPVVVLVDDKRALKPSQPKLDFYDGSRARPVRFESTDEQELVGVLDADGFGGFTVAPGKTVTVKLRLSLASDVAPDHITANAAVVQRRGQDGDWIGESNDYRFGVGDDQDTDAQETEDTEATGDTGGTEEPNASEDADGTATGSADTSSTPNSTASASTPTPTSSSAPDSSLPLARDAQEAGERARELAGTGPGLSRGLLAAASAVLAVGGGAFLLARRRR